MPLLAAKSIDLVLCDLPYGTTQNKWDSVIPLDKLWSEYSRIARGAIVLTAAQPFTSSLVFSNLSQFKYQWVWKKPQATGHLNAKKQPMRAHEDVLVFYYSQPTYNPQMTIGKPYTQKSGRASENWGSQVSVLTENSGERYPLSVQEFSSDRDKLHPTQKPVALMEYLIRTYTNEGDTVLDNCMGSGTTGVACMNTERNFIGIEQDPAYFQIAKNRIEEAEFQKAVDVASRMG
jgi:site-specific DNA-methyltransferase (adenine-specific)